MDAVAGHTTQPCERQRPMAMADAGRRIGAGSWRASPSTSTWGTNRSSHRGNHQFLSPRSSMEAGTRNVLTMVASIKLAVASARPNRLRMALGLNRNDAKPVVMIAAAALINLAVVAMPSATAVVLSPVRRYSSRMREMRNRHLVVHGQPEEDREQHPRRERMQRPGSGAPETPPETPP